MASMGQNSVSVGRYLLHRQIARGGMATIHIARLLGDEGFSRIVAAKRLLPEIAGDTEFVAMFMDEARIASKIHHPNVVPVLDLVTTSDEVMLVQEYVHGVPLHVLLRTTRQQTKKVPVRIAVSIAAQVLAGLHAAHSTVDEMGEPLDIVHRDVSPQNVMVAIDGSARLLDFGIAKATMAAHVTREGTFKGKLAYSAPEQLRGKPVQQSDVYALAVVLWELLVGQRMHGSAKAEAEVVSTILAGKITPIIEELSAQPDWSTIDSEEWKLLALVEPIVSKGLAVALDQRYASAADMERELTRAVSPASTSEVAAWVRALGKDFIEDRDKIIAAEEASWRRTHANLGTMPGNRRLTVPPVDSRESADDLALPVDTRPSSHDLSLAIPVPPPAPAPMFTLKIDQKVIVGVLATLVVLLGVGVVFAMQSGPHPAAAATPMAAPRPAPATGPIAPSPAAVSPAPAQPVPAVTRPPRGVAEPRAVAEPRGVAEPAAVAPARRAAPKPAPRPARLETDAQIAPAAAPARPEATPATD